MIYAFMLCGREMWCERFVDDIKIEPSARIFPEKAGVQPVNAIENSINFNVAQPNPTVNAQNIPTT